MHTLRKECGNCGGTSGKIETRNGQDCVFCDCGRFQYNAPKNETGRESRSVSTSRAAIKPNQRSRIIERANSRCERCGKHALESATGLHVGHILSVAEADASGISHDIVNSDENLICECDECNLGHGKGCLPVRFVVALITARMNNNG